MKKNCKNTDNGKKRCRVIARLAQRFFFAGHQEVVQLLLTDTRISSTYSSLNRSVSLTNLLVGGESDVDSVSIEQTASEVSEDN